MSGAALLAGAGRCEMTPPCGLRLSGYAGRPGRSAGCRDPLVAAALYLHDGSRTLLLLTLDIIGLTPRDDRLLRGRIAGRLETSPDAVLIACSHTHAAPAAMTIRGTGRKEAAWTAELFDAAISAVDRARQTAAPVTRARQGSAPCRAAINRRVRRGNKVVIAVNPDGPVDSTCSALLLESTAGPLAALFHYGMHPVVLDEKNLQVSADWVGSARRKLEETLGCPALFLQGCCGDINPPVREREQPDALERLGAEVAEAALTALREARTMTDRGLGSGAARARLPLSPPPSEQELSVRDAAAAAALGRAESSAAERHLALADRAWVRCWRSRLRGRRAIPSSAAARVAALRIGEVLLLALPGEPFAAIGIELRRELPGCWPSGYAAGNLGYLYPDSALAEGGYEIDLAYRLYGQRQAARGTAAALIEAARRAARPAGGHEA